MPHSVQRRVHPRYNCFCFAHFHRPNTGPTEPEQLCVTNNFSHDGVYFLAFDSTLREKMQLLLNFPYHDLPAVKMREYLIEIVRINSRFHQRCGVGARLVLDTQERLLRSPFLLERHLPKRNSADPESQRIDLYV